MNKISISKVSNLHKYIGQCCRVQDGKFTAVRKTHILILFYNIVFEQLLAYGLITVSHQNV